MANALGFCRRCGARISLDKDHCDLYPNCKLSFSTDEVREAGKLLKDREDAETQSKENK